MSTKEWVYRSDDGAGLYQEMSFDKYNNNPATIEIENPMDFKIEREEFPSGKAFFTLTAEIPSVRFDELSIAWLKHRGIQARLNKYTLGEMLTECDFKWPISEEELLHGIENAELIQILRDRECQEEIPANLGYDDIFDLVNDDEEAERLKAQSDVVIKNRDVSELRGMFASQINNSVENFKSAAVGILEHIKAEQSISDEKLLISVIQYALQEAVVGIQFASCNEENTPSQLSELHGEQDGED
jgi:hypothetical protein